MSEKWQEALNLWDSWRNSVDQARNELLSKYDGIRRLMSRTREDDKSLSASLDEISDKYERIIANDIGLKSDSTYYEDLLYTWMHLVLPELVDEYDPEYERDDSSQEKRLDIWQGYEAKRKGRGYEVIYSVNWIPGKVTLNDILEKIHDMEWPSISHLKLKAKGGRPSKEYRNNLETIVCAILKDKQHLTHIEIGTYFGWEIQPNEWGKPKTCQTSFKRVKQGRKILENPA